MLFPAALYYKYDANRDFKKNDLFFNQVGGIQEKWTSRSSQQDANMVYTKGTGLRITLLNYWIISCANSVSTWHVSFTMNFREPARLVAVGAANVLNKKSRLVCSLLTSAPFKLFRRPLARVHWPISNVSYDLPVKSVTPLSSSSSPARRPPALSPSTLFPATDGPVSNVSYGLPLKSVTPLAAS